MSFTGLVTTMEPTPTYIPLSPADLEPVPPYVPTPTAADMDDSIPGKVYQCIYKLKDLEGHISDLTLTKLHLMTTIEDVKLMLHNVVTDLSKIDLKDAYQAFQPGDPMNNDD